MFSQKPRPARTVADVIAQKKRLRCTCMACRTITNLKPDELFYPPKMELVALERVIVCPECGAGNVSGEAKQLILTIEDWPEV